MKSRQFSVMKNKKTATVFSPAAVENLVIPRGLEPLLPT